MPAQRRKALSCRCRPTLTRRGPQAELDEIRRKLAESRKQEKSLSRKAETLDAEVRDLRDQLVAAAAKVQDYEESLSYLENRLRALQREDKLLRESLASRREQMARVLTALQRLSWRPKETLLMQPATPEATVRSALLLRSAVPALAEEAETLRADLASLKDVEAAIAIQRDEIAGLGSQFEAEHARLQQLVAEKARLMESASLRSQEAARQARQLADEAESMKDFLARLAEERRKREAELARQRALALAVNSRLWLVPSRRRQRNGASLCPPPNPGRQLAPARPRRVGASFRRRPRRWRPQRQRPT